MPVKPVIKDAGPLVAWLKRSVCGLLMTKNIEVLPPPILLTFIICDMVIVDAMTGKHSIIGAFEAIHAKDYPARHPWLAVFCQCTNGRGKADITIRLVDVQEDDHVVAEQMLPVTFQDVRQVVNLGINIGGIVFPHPGEYRFQIYAGTMMVGERRIVCQQMQTGGQDT